MININFDWSNLLIMAAKKGSEGITRLIIEKGTSINTTDDGVTLDYRLSNTEESTEILGDDPSANAITHN